MEITNRQVYNAVRTLAQTETRPRIQRTKEAGKLLLKHATDRDAKQFHDTVNRIPCRRCGARRHITCLTKTGKPSPTAHTVRVDDAWDIVRGRESWERVVKRPALKTEWTARAVTS